MTAQEPTKDDNGLVPADDGFPMDPVGPWAKEKHERLRKYVDISRAARRKFLKTKPGTKYRPGGATYIDLFCGYGRSFIRGTEETIDGSALVAFKSASFSGTGFSDIHISDSDRSKVDATMARLEACGGTASPYGGTAAEVASKVVSKLNPHGLHFAFLDPFNLAALPFSVIEAFSSLEHIDMLIHVSAQDLTRNLRIYIQDHPEALEAFAPGWREQVDLKQSELGIRAALFEYWRQKIKDLGISPAYGTEIVRGSKNQRLYWLVFVGRHNLAHKFWNAIRDISDQRTLF